MTANTNRIQTPFNIGHISRTDTITESNTKNKTKSIWRNFIEGLACGAVGAIAYFAFSASLITAVILVVAVRIIINQGKI